MHGLISLQSNFLKFIFKNEVSEKEIALNSFTLIHDPKVIKLRKIAQAGHVASTLEIRNVWST
jgi:hypothetical protein